MPNTKRLWLYLTGVLLMAGAGILTVSGFPFDTQFLTTVKKNGVDLELRSEGKMMADEVLSGRIMLEADATPSPVSKEDRDEEVEFRGDNVQVNDPALDNIQTFAGLRPFVKFTQSETTVAAHNDKIVVSYNSSAGVKLVRLPTGQVVFQEILLSGFSTSNDRGRTFTSGFVPPVRGASATFGDGVVTVDEEGNFYYSTLGIDAQGNGTVQVNKSTDRGRTWSDAVVAAVDDGSDKEWIAAGPAPGDDDRTNLYVTWTSFQQAPPPVFFRSELRFARSTDGGRTWTSKTVFAPGPDPNPVNPQQFIQFSVPVVDRETGRLYIGFMHFSNADQDFLRILVSDNAGETFRFATFNVPGAFSPSVLPVVQAGELIDCGSPGGGLRVAIHQGSNIGGGRFGLRRFVRATRLVTQPALAASDGRVFLAWSNSDSPFFGDPTAGSNILFLRSNDGGRSWTRAVQVNPSRAADIQHVHPAVALEEGEDKRLVHISYYTQHANASVDLDLANSDERGDTFPDERVVRVNSIPFNLAPTNIPIPTSAQPFRTTNYDRIIVPCYSLGEYNGLTWAGGKLHAVWGDSRNLVTQPVNPLDPISGQRHPQQDVFFQTVKVED